MAGRVPLQHQHHMLATPAVGLEQPRVKASRMDDINYLLFRNIELETELRLCKEQLAQAQSGTQYLVSCISSQQPQYHKTNAEDFDNRLRQVEAENLRLERHLALTQSYSHKGLSKLEQCTIEYPEPQTQAHSESNFLPGDLNAKPAEHANAREVELLTFEDDEPSPYSRVWMSSADSPSTEANGGSSLIDSPIGTPLTPFTPDHVQQKAFTPECGAKPIGLGIYNIDSPKQSVFVPSESTIIPPNRPSNHVAPESSDKFHPLPPTQHDQGSTSEETEQWHAIHSPPPPEPDLIFSAPFINAEHNRLLGAASFVEEMSDAEREEHWMMLERQKGRHSAREWRVYYEEIVRPIFLAKLAEKAEARESALFSSPETEIDNSSDDKLVENMKISGEKLGGLSTSRWAPKLGEDPVPPDVAKPRLTNTFTTVQGTMWHDMRAVEDISPFNQSSQCTVIGPMETPEHIPAAGKELRGHDKTTESSSPAPPNCLSGEHALINGSTPSSHQLMPAQPSYTPEIGLHSFDNRAVPLASRTPFRRRSPPSFNLRTEDPILHDFDSTNENLFHTVLISSITPSKTIADVLNIVRGGKVISATFLETAGMKTDPPLAKNTAIIVFLEARSARRYVDFCRQHSITLPADSSEPVCASLLRTPSYPLDPKIIFDIRERGLTRVLFIIDAQHTWTPEGVVQELKRFNSNLKESSRTLHRPVIAIRDQDGVLVFVFADVRDAATAWNVVDRDHWYFQGASKGFLPDPCARPLESLKEDGLVGERSGEGCAATVEDADESDGESTVIDTLTSSFGSKHGAEAVADSPASSFTSTDVEREDEGNQGAVDGEKSDGDGKLQSSLECP